jgi:hypothetical protein
MTSEKSPGGKFASRGRTVPLEGLDAGELYLAQIEDNLKKLTETVTLLQATVVERIELLHQSVSSRAGREKLLLK